MPDNDELKRLREELDRYKRLATQRGARMQKMRAYMNTPQIDELWMSPWESLIDRYPEVENWFDADGVPVED